MISTDACFILETNECPLLDALERRCRGVDVLSGDIYQDLLPACGAHQLCYLCVSPTWPQLNPLKPSNAHPSHRALPRRTVTSSTCWRRTLCARSRPAARRRPVRRWLFSAGSRDHSWDRESAPRIRACTGRWSKQASADCKKFSRVSVSVSQETQTNTDGHKHKHTHTLTLRSAMFKHTNGMRVLLWKFLWIFFSIRHRLC